MIEALANKPSRQERPPVKKPTPPPKLGQARRRTAEGDNCVAASEAASAPTSAPATPLPRDASATAAAGVDAAPTMPEAAAEPAALAELAPATTLEPSASADAPPREPELLAAQSGTTVLQAERPMEPVVPRTGELFTSTDIDSIMDRLGSVAGPSLQESQDARASA